MSDCGPRNIPPNHWRYPRGDGGWIEGADRENLVDEITKHRVSNNLTIGDPLYDLQKYIVATYPDHAGSVSVARPEIDPDTIAKNLRERVASWASTRYGLRAGGNTELVSQEEAQRRAQICQACPENTQIPNDCASCVQSVQRTTFLLRQGNKTGLDLQCCAVSGQCNETSAFLPPVMLAHRKKFLDELKEKAPKCWLINLS